LERGTAQTRKGAKRLADAISTADEPLTLSFDLAADVEIPRSPSAAPPRP
jgi:hypothetical protein